MKECQVQRSDEWWSITSKETANAATERHLVHDVVTERNSTGDVSRSSVQPSSEVKKCGRQKIKIRFNIIACTSSSFIIGGPQHTYRTSSVFLATVFKRYSNECKAWMDRVCDMYDFRSVGLHNCRQEASSLWQHIFHCTTRDDE